MATLSRIRYPSGIQAYWSARFLWSVEHNSRFCSAFPFRVDERFCVGSKKVSEEQWGIAMRSFLAALSSSHSNMLAKSINASSSAARKWQAYLRIPVVALGDCIVNSYVCDSQEVNIDKVHYTLAVKLSSIQSETMFKIFFPPLMSCWYNNYKCQVSLKWWMEWPRKMKFPKQLMQNESYYPASVFFLQWALI